MDNSKESRRQRNEQRRKEIKQHNLINNSLHMLRAFKVIDHLDELLAPLCLGKDEWAIGGSVALLLYGGEINRIPHDLDLIVSSTTLAKIKIITANSWLYAEGVTSSTDVELGTNHYAIKVANGFIIDFIVYDGMPIKDSSIHYTAFDGINIRVMDIDHLLTAKKTYNRVKDKEDLEELRKIYDKVNIIHLLDNETTTQVKADNDALAALKAKMEKNADEA